VGRQGDGRPSARPSPPLTPSSPRPFAIAIAPPDATPRAGTFSSPSSPCCPPTTRSSSRRRGPPRATSSCSTTSGSSARRRRHPPSRCVTAVYRDICDLWICLLSLRLFHLSPLCGAGVQELGFHAHPRALPPLLALWRVLPLRDVRHPANRRAAVVLLVVPSASVAGTWWSER